MLTRTAVNTLRCILGPKDTMYSGVIGVAARQNKPTIWAIRDAVDSSRSNSGEISPALARGLLYLKAQIEVHHTDPKELKEFLDFFSEIRAEIYAAL